MNRDLKIISALMVLCGIGSVALTTAMSAYANALIHNDAPEPQARLMMVLAAALSVVLSFAVILAVLPTPQRFSAHSRAYARLVAASAVVSWVALLLMTSICLSGAMIVGAAFVLVCFMNKNSTAITPLAGKRDE